MIGCFSCLITVSKYVYDIFIIWPIILWVDRQKVPWQEPIPRYIVPYKRLWSKPCRPQLAPTLQPRTHFYNSCSNITIDENILPNSKICDWVACMHECAQLHVIDSCTSNPHQSSAAMLEKLADQLHQRGLVNFWPKYSSPQSSCHACKFPTTYRDVTELSWHMLDPNGKLYLTLENSKFTACLEELSPIKCIHGFHSNIHRNMSTIFQYCILEHTHI
jgi:hypothetical protein